MTKELQELFNGLNKLCSENEAFYFAEQAYGEDYIVRSYTYRLASWSDFQLPFAKDCRGTAFILDKRTGEWNLFCRAYRKFFNLHELGPGITKAQFMQDNKAIFSFEKLDGSLILVSQIDGNLVAKSKTSINSEHAKKANELIANNMKLQNFIRTSLDEGYTPVFELCGPGEFKIVLNYTETELVFLGYVDKITAEVSNFTGYGFDFKETTGVRPAEIYDFSWGELLKIQEESDAKIEGFVVKLDNGDFVKCKTAAYCQLHHLKDNINNNSNLIPLIVNDNLDDIIGAFQDDADTLKYISEIQEKVFHLFNHYVVVYKELRNLYFTDFGSDRKSFALAHKDNELFAFIMRAINSTEEIEVLAEKAVKDYILNKCKTKSLADVFVNSLGIK